MKWSQESKIMASYGSFSLFLSILHNVFLLYHVEVFVSMYHISQRAFWVAEGIFLLWNSFNDQLFSWFSDKSFLNSNLHKLSKNEVVIHRLRSIKIAGPLLAVSFTLFWYKIPFISTGVQFAICLCLYDSMLTLVDLQQSALLADLSLTSTGRVSLGTYSATFSGIGSLSVFLSYLFWETSDPKYFRMFCFTLALMSLIGFHLSTQFMIKFFRESKDFNEDRLQSFEKSNDQPIHIQSRAFLTYFKQVLRHKNFVRFTLMNLIQVFSCHFNSNFFPLFLKVLLSESLSPTLVSGLLGFSFLAPHLNNLYFMQMCHKFGTYRVVKALFAVKLCFCLSLLILGPYSVIPLCIFIASNRIFTEGICKLLCLVISDLVDEDMVLHQRPQAVSALIFGTSALLSKPGQTLAPIAGTLLLTWQTGKNLFDGANANLWMNKEASFRDFKERDACFWLLIMVPMFCTVTQLLIWSSFTLHGQKLKNLKQLRLSREKGPYYENI